MMRHQEKAYQLHPLWMASRLTIIGRSAALKGVTLTMSGATALNCEAVPMPCAGIGEAKDPGTYLNLRVFCIYKVLVASRLDETDGGGDIAIVQFCMRNVVQCEQGRMPSLGKTFLSRAIGVWQKD